VGQDSNARRRVPRLQVKLRLLGVILSTAAGVALIPGAAEAAAPYANCTEVWQELGRPIFPQDPGYNFSLDADRDGIGCETKPTGVIAKSPPAPRRHALQSKTYNHLGNPTHGQARSDTWIYEFFSAWPDPVAVQGVSRAAKISKVARIQVNVTRLEDEHGLVWARNGTAVNSGTASSATQATAHVNAAAASTCAAPVRLRVRSAISVRWSDGTLSNISVLGPFTTTRWCRT
jgi:hypothetical protein